MTKSEIIVQLEDLARDAKGRIDPTDPEDIFRRDYETLTEAAEILKDGKQVKWMRGEWIWDTSGPYPKPVCSRCGEEPYRRSNHTSDLPNYCPSCGAPMTDEAVQMVMQRLEALHGSL